MQFYVFSLVNHTHAAAAELLDDAVVRNGLADHGSQQLWMAILGCCERGVNEDDTPMDAGNGKSRDFGLSQALANQVVRKGVCGDFILCGFSPYVSADWSLVHRYTF
jgi:hypothetical protein